MCFRGCVTLQPPGKYKSRKSKPSEFNEDKELSFFESGRLTKRIMNNPNLDIRDDRMVKVVDTDTQLEIVADGFEFIEGPIWHPYEHHLIFSDIIGDTMYRWQRDKGAEVFRQPSHMANGNTYDRKGRILTCEHATSRVTRTDQKGRTEVLASHYKGNELNSPNDIVVRSDGRIYFTDPNSGRSPRFGVERPQELITMSLGLLSSFPL